MPNAVGIERLLAHREWLQRLARSLVADAATAEDLAQDTWAAALRSPPRDEASPRGWLATVARNLARNRHRDGDRRGRREEAVARRDLAGSTAELVSRAEMQALVANAVVGLGEPYRTTVLLRYFEDLPPREIARAMGVSVEAVKSRLRRAHERLRERIGEKGDRDRRAVLFALLPLARGGRPTAWSAVAGGLVMGAKTWAAAILVIAAGSGIVWVASRRDAASRPDPPAAETAAARDERRRASERRDDLPPPVDLGACDRNLDLHGVVVDGDGRPVPGAKVETVDFAWRRTSVLNVEQMYAEETGPSGLSASDGTFALRLRRGARVALRASAPGFATTEVPGCQSGERLRVVLGPGVHLLLRCRDETGAPVAGAAVELSPYDPLLRDPTTPHRAVSGSTGEAIVEGLTPGGMLMVTAVHPRLASLLDSPMVALPNSGAIELLLPFGVGRTLHGRVTDAATGTPIAGARVATAWTARRFAETAADGRFELPGVTSGDFAYHVRAEGYAEGIGSLAVSDVVDIALRRGDRVQGRLTGPDGRPAAGAFVSVTSHGAGGSDRARHATSGDDGTFTVTDLRHDQPHCVTFQAEGLGRYLLDFDPAAQEGGTIDLGTVTLPAGRLLEGRVLGADGSPVAGAVVNLYGFNEDRERLRPGRSFVSTMYGCRESRRTDDLGRFRFPDLCPGDYDLSVISADTRTAQAAVALPADRDVGGVEIRLPEGSPFVVDVKDSAGAALAGVSVSIGTKSGWGGQSTTRADGRVTFAVPSDVVTISAFPWVRTLIPVPSRRVAAGSASATLVVRRANAVRGRIADPEGRPFLPRTFLRVFEAGRPLGIDPWGQNVLGIHNDGSFEVSVPLDGTIDLVLAPSAGPDGRLLHGELRGLRPDTQDLVLRTREVPLDREMTVVVHDPDGRPEPGAEVEANLAPGRTVGPVVSGPSGRAYLRGLPATEVTLRAQLPADHPHRDDWIAASAANVSAEAGEFELTFEQGRRVAGIVRGPDGRPAAGAAVYVHLSQSPFAAVECGADGRFAIAVPREATKSLHLLVAKWPEPGVNWEYRQDGIPDPATDLDITLRLAGR